MPLFPNPYPVHPGSTPPILAGRDTVLTSDPSVQARLLTGLRGSGKTALLGALAAQAPASSTLLGAGPGRHLAQALIPALRALLHGLPSGAPVARALTVLAGFRAAQAARLPPSPADPPGQPGQGDSGDLEADLSALLSALGSLAGGLDAGLTLLVDDAHALMRAELDALLRAWSAAAPAHPRLRLVLAGLPFLASLDVHERALLERHFQMDELGALDARALSQAVQGPALAQGRSWNPDALAELGRASKGHPALLQAWAHHAWETAADGPLDASAVRRAGPACLRSLDRRYYGPGFEALAPRERAYLRSMAHLGPGPHRSSDIADSMDAKVTALGPLRAKLIKEGWVYGPQHGLLGFTAPGMDEFMRRVMPNFR